MSLYSDLNSFTPTSNPKLLDIQSVYQALFDLFNTRPGERLFLEEFGLDLEEELFEIIDNITEVRVLTLVLATVTRWEARVKIDRSRTTITADPDNNKYDLDMYFAILGVEGQTFQFRGSFTS